jgi:hypothetical protein
MRVGTQNHSGARSRAGRDGDNVIISPAISDDDAKEKFPRASPPVSRA